MRKDQKGEKHVSGKTTFARFPKDVSLSTESGIECAGKTFPHILIHVYGTQRNHKNFERLCLKLGATCQPVHVGASFDMDTSDYDNGHIVYEIWGMIGALVALMHHPIHGENWEYVLDVRVPTQAQGSGAEKIKHKTSLPKQNWMERKLPPTGAPDPTFMARGGDIAGKEDSPDKLSCIRANDSHANVVTEFNPPAPVPLASLPVKKCRKCANHRKRGDCRFCARHR